LKVQTTDDPSGNNLLIGMEARAPNLFVNFRELGHYGELFMGTWKKEPPLNEGG
jgi:hypothetical protein